MGMEGHAFLFNLAQRSQRKNLEPARIGQHGAVPTHELMQPAHLPDNRVTRAHVQMVGVGQLDLTAQRLQIEGVHRAFDGARRADVHKDRRLHQAVGGLELPAAGAPGGFQ